MFLQERFTKQAYLLVGIGVVAFLILTSLGLWIWTRQYNGRIAPNILIGTTPVGGLTHEQAAMRLQQKIDPLLVDGIPLELNDNTQALALTTLSADDAIDLVEFDTNASIDRAIRTRRDSNPLKEVWLMLASTWQPISIPLSVVYDAQTIKQSVMDLYPDAVSPGTDATYVFIQTPTNWEATVKPGVDGTEFDWQSFFTQFDARLRTLSSEPMIITLTSTTPSVSNEQAEELADAAVTKLLTAPITFTHTDERGKSFSWTLTRQQLAPLLRPSSNARIQIDPDEFNTFLDPIAETIEHPAQNARLVLDNGRVKEFLESKQGKRLNREELRLTLETTDIQTIPLVFLVEEPVVTTADVNDLGIDQILGVGMSSYRGSPSNRRKNIQNGVNLLNGLLIAPGETFSLVDALKPFEISNGYLPELVIKGNQIIPEVGGGLCQIGTTTFRAAMNAGLPVVERRNHSLVVSYYNDPSNKNPGTDATIYDPAPDFKFLNDTGHYILFQAENLLDTQELRFTFWGTSDGRKGSYNPPTVIRWIPVGVPVITETTSLPPGKQNCQEAHIGADTTFDYTIVRPDGTTETTTFDSHYRPLPKLCLIGVEAPAEQTEPIPESPQPSPEAQPVIE